MTEKEINESDDDMHRIIEVLQSQIASMQSELNEVKTELKQAREEKPGEEHGEIVVAAAEPEPEPETREEVIEYMKKLPGIGLSKAGALYDNGFDSTQKLKDATAEEFIAVPGIGPSMASKLVVSIEKLEEGTLEPTAEPPAAEPETPPEEGGGPMGFFKNLSSKLMGFIRGKKPEGEVQGESTSVGEEESPEAGVDSEETPEGDIPEAPSGETKDESRETAAPEEGSKDESRETIETPEDGSKDERRETIETSEEESKEEPPDVTVEEPPAQLEPTEPEVPEEPGELTREDILAQFKKLEGVNDPIAVALYDAGYESMDELKEAEEDDLKMVDGIGPKTAESIIRSLKE